MRSTSLSADSVNLQRKAYQIRRLIFETIARAGGGHFGGSLSVVEILTVLYFHVLRVGEAAVFLGREHAAVDAGLSQGEGQKLRKALRKLGAETHCEGKDQEHERHC